MQKYHESVLNETGTPAVGVSVLVSLLNGSVATIYSDNGATETSNPLTTNSLGYFEFYAADGRYTLTISGSGIETINITDVLLEDPQDGSAMVIDGGSISNSALSEITIDGVDVDGADIAKYSRLSNSDGSGLIGFIQSGTGAVARTVQAKMRDVISVKDFGAVGNGVTNDTAALNAALVAGAGKLVEVPPGTYLHDDALVIPSGTWLRGHGESSILKCTALASGGSGIGLRQIDATSKTNFRISDLAFDASGITSFPAGMRSIWLSGSSQFSVERCHFKTPGAATAALNCSYYTIANNHISCESGDAAAHHDGVIDQWGASHSFKVLNNTILGNSLGRYLILVTGEDTAGSPTAVFDFVISGNILRNAKINGIWVNGRGGVNYDFSIIGNVVDTVADFFGIAVSDAYDFVVNGNTIKSTGLNGIRLYQESGEGTFSCKYAVVSNNVIDSANVLASANIVDGSAITIYDSSTKCTIAGNVVKGTTHRYAVLFGGSTSLNELTGSNYETGVDGVIFSTPVTNRVPSATYAPTLTAVANVSASTPRTLRWTRSGDVVRVNGRVEVTPTAAASTTTQLGISLPVASNFTDATADCAGVAATQFAVVGAIIADTTNDRATLQFPAPNTSSNVFYFSFEYTVK